jgi:hypothetical protein
MTFQELLEENFETREYSGRGMFGKYCLAITIENKSDLLETMYRIGYMVAEHNLDENNQNEDNDLDDTIDETGLNNIKYDSLGNGLIIYWPNIPFKKEIE